MASSPLSKRRLFTFIDNTNALIISRYWHSEANTNLPFFKQILKLLRGLQTSHNLAVIYITHDLSTVRYFSERIFVMYAGKIVEKADVNSLMNTPRHPYTLALLAATPEPDAHNALVYKEIPPGEPPNLVSPPSGCHFHPRCAQAMQGLCDVQDPPDFQVGPSHLTACWLYQNEPVES